MSKLIDNVFDYDTIRYVPVNIQNEWKNLYNLYKGSFFQHQKKIYNIYCSIQNDYKNDEINKLNYMTDIMKIFKNQVLNIQPKLNSDYEHSENVKKKLLKSIFKINKFLKYKKYLFKKRKKLNKSSKKEKNIERFSDLNEKKLTFNKKNVILVLIFILFTYLILN